MGVTPANRLADRFKISHNGRPIQPGADIVQFHEAERGRETIRTHDALDRLFAPKVEKPVEAPPVQPAAPTPAPAASQDLASTGVETRLDRVIEALGNQTAALDLLVENMAKLGESMAKFDAREQQAISATASLTAMLARNQDGIASGLMQVVQVVREGQIDMASNLLGVVQAIRETRPAPEVIETKAEIIETSAPEVIADVDPAVYAEFDPQTAIAAQPAEIEGATTPRSEHRSELVDETSSDDHLEHADGAGVMDNAVYSKMESGNRPYTIIKIEREAFNRAGISPNGRVVVEYLSDKKLLNIRAVETGGVKIKMANNKSVHIQSRTLGDLHMARARCIPGSNEISLRAM